MFSDLSSSLASHLISTESKGENLVFSPLSIHVVLALTASGSGGPTRDQILAYFSTDSVDELKTLFSQQVPQVLADGSPLGGPRLSFANGVWVDLSLNFKPDFKRIVENDYKAASNRADFQNKCWNENLFGKSSECTCGDSFGVILAWKLRLVRDVVLGPPVNLSLLQKWQSNAHNVSEDLFVRILVPINLYDLFLGSADELVSLLNKTTFSEFDLKTEDCFLPPSWKNVSCPEWPCTRKERAFRFRALFLREEAG